MEESKKIPVKEVIQTRDIQIDAAKGIGILLVILGHHLLDSEGVRMWIYSFHMPLFFILSGYLSRSLEETKLTCGTSVVKHARKKAKALLYPYVTFSLVNLIWYFLFHYLLGFQADIGLQDAVLRTITTFGYHALWFLPAMFFVSVISKWGEQNGLFRPVPQFLLIICAAAFSVLLNRAGYPHNLFWKCGVYIGRIIIGVVFVGIGKYIEVFLGHIDEKRTWVTLAVSAAVSFWLCRFLPDVSLAFVRLGNPVIFYLAACAGSVGVILLCKKTAVGKSRLLQFIGENSLVIMALHMDIPIQLAWFIVGGTGISSLLSQRYASACAIVIELVLLIIMVLAINNCLPWLLYPHKGKHYEKV